MDRADCLVIITNVTSFTATGQQVIHIHAFCLRIITTVTITKHVRGGVVSIAQLSSPQTRRVHHT
jgi:hypothetical protein